MKRLFSTVTLAATAAIAAGLACGDDSTTPPRGAGSVSGRVTFIGTWPSTGDVQVSIYSSLTPPDYAPTGPPDAYTNPIASGTMEYNYQLSGLDNGTYAGVLVSWREPANPSGAKMIGLYWIYPDSVAVEPSGVSAKSPGPTPVIISTSDPSHTGLNITADLDIAP